MEEKDDEIAHPGMVSKPEKHLILAQFSNSPWTRPGNPIRAPPPPPTEAFLESLELLEEYAPIWYTEQHHKRAVDACRILQANPSHTLGSERNCAS
jgi:hypothetical protein